MGTSLEYLLAEGVISEIIGRVQSGKEAEVYAVRYGDNVVAAKVYKDRAQRSFKSNAAYKEGRSVRNSRDQRAMERGTSFGKDTAEEAWKAEEANALYRLHGAGVRVPTPILFMEGVLLMELVRDGDGEIAPRVIDARLTPAEANAAYHDMLTQLVRMLSNDLIHGDLSPYNVLWAAAGPTIIDFPQVVSAAQNRNSESFFLRDARNVLGYFAQIDRSLRARAGDAHEIWSAYMRRELTPDFVPLGRSTPRHEPRAFAPHNEPRASGPRNERSFAPHNEPRASGPRNERAVGPRHDARTSAPRGDGMARGQGPAQGHAPARAQAPARAPHAVPAPAQARSRTGNGQRPKRAEVLVLVRRPLKPAPTTPKSELDAATTNAEPRAGEHRRR